jgi:dihydroflavonol-4-reductase
MDILVTGATGFVGAHLCRRLARDGHRVTVFRRSSSDLSLLRGVTFQDAVGELTDEESVERAVQNHEAVIHAAASLTQSSLLYKVNVAGTDSVIAACRKGGVRRLVHVSSVAAIGISPDRQHPANETCSFGLESGCWSYGSSKRQAEKRVLQASSTGLDAVIVNPSWIFGPHGQIFRGSEVFIKVLRNKVLPCFDGGGNAVHVHDVVDGIVAALKVGRTGERYILGGENLTWRQMSEIAANVFGLKRVFVPVPSLVTNAAALMFGVLGTATGWRPRISRHLASRFSYYDSGKASAELGYHPRPYRQIVEDYSRFRERPS